MTRSTRIILLSLLCYASAIRAQDLARPAQTDRIIHTLEDIGFENIRVVRTKDRLILAYENRRYRYEITGFREVLASVAANLGNAPPVTFIQEHDGVPLRALTVSATGFDLVRSDSAGQYAVEGLNASIDIEDDWATLRGAPRHASSFGRLDLVVQPRITVQFGDYDDALQTQIGLVPELTTTLARGLRFRAQVILPLQNDLDEEGDYVRPGLVSLSQALRLRYNTFVAVSAGYFSANRYGVDVQTRAYFLNGRFAIGGRIGFTGFASFRSRESTYTDIDTWTGALTFDANFPRYALTVRSAFERFVFEDYGWRLDLVRAFGEIQIGLYGLVSEGTDNAGVSLSIPLFPARYSHPQAIRVRPARDFDWEYRYRNLPLSGRRYATGYEIDRLWGGVLPALFESLASRASKSR